MQNRGNPDRGHLSSFARQREKLRKKERSIGSYSFRERVLARKPHPFPHFPSLAASSPLHSLTLCRQRIILFTLACFSLEIQLAQYWRNISLTYNNFLYMYSCSHTFSHAHTLFSQGSDTMNYSSQGSGAL